jgi:hypothetical protein
MTETMPVEDGRACIPTIVATMEFLKQCSLLARANHMRAMQVKFTAIYHVR